MEWKEESLPEGGRENRDWRSGFRDHDRRKERLGMRTVRWKDLGILKLGNF